MGAGNRGVGRRVVGRGCRLVGWVDRWRWGEMEGKGEWACLDLGGLRRGEVRAIRGTMKGDVEGRNIGRKLTRDEAAGASGRGSAWHEGGWWDAAYEV